MGPDFVASEPNNADDFQRAAAAAEAGHAAWSILLPSEQTRAIYDQLRQLDLERAKAMALAPNRGRPSLHRRKDGR